MKMMLMTKVIINIRVQRRLILIVNLDVLEEWSFYTRACKVLFLMRRKWN